jgi:hypothetical protein
LIYLFNKKIFTRFEFSKETLFKKSKVVIPDFKHRSANTLARFIAALKSLVLKQLKKINDIIFQMHSK